MHGRVTVWSIFILFFVLTISIAVAEKPQRIRDITASEAFYLIEERSDDPRFIILDIRTEDEFMQGHIENARNLDYRSEDFSQMLKELDREDTYLLYCRSGGRSGKALRLMRELGFREVYHLFEGIITWQEEGFPVIK